MVRRDSDRRRGRSYGAVVTTGGGPDRAHWQERLDALLAEHGVVGASLGVLHDGAVTTWAGGRASTATGAPVRPDTVFQIGSITKVWTATLAMQLVDEGRLALDEPVTRYLPGLELPDPTVTVRHLLTHSSGLLGDHFPDVGDGADALERYAAGLRDVEQLFPPGTTMSYCNSGFVLLGRLLQVLDGAPWERVLATRLLEPLGLTRSAVRAADLARLPLADGHLHPPGTEPAVVPCHLPWAVAPAGLLRQPVDELLALARLHLDGGLAPDGRRLLSARSAAAMQQVSIDIPDPLMGRQVGLGWLLDERDGRLLVGHTGNTTGQSAYLALVPDSGLAIALLTNSGGHPRFGTTLRDELLAELAGLPPAPVREPDGELVPAPDRYVGTYVTGDGPVTVLEDSGRLFVQMPGDPEQRVALLPHRGDTLLAAFPSYDMHVPVTFYEVDGRRYLHTQGRVAPELVA
jgi:CubicO group peptidase (beta-lactamase class C family)